MPLIAPQLGQPIAQLGPRYPATVDIPALGEWITNLSPNTATGLLANTVGSQTGSSNTWFAANCPYAVPFVLNSAVTAYQIGWSNGSSAGGNFDAGIYDTSWNRKVSAGSTVGSGANSWQFVDVADTFLAAGSYYFVLCLDNVTANRVGTLANNSVNQASQILAGIQDSATTAFPLPDPLTNMALVATAIQAYVWAIAVRALI